MGQVTSYFVDQVAGSNTTNFLFRGTDPEINPDNGLGPVYAAISLAAEQAGVTLPDTYFLVDINLLQPENPGDLTTIVTEYEYFNSSPGNEQGELVCWPIEGVGLDPGCITEDNRRNCLAAIYDAWQPDTLIERIALLRSWLGGDYYGLPNPPPANTSWVFYVHCSGGCDRTGEVIAAYSMQYLGTKWDDINYTNYNCCGGRPFGCRNYNAARWYCLWIYLTTGQDLGCLDKLNYDPPCTQAEPEPWYPCPQTDENPNIFPCP